MLELIVAKRLRRGLLDGHRLDRPRPGGPGRLPPPGRRRRRAVPRRRRRHARAGDARPQPGPARGRAVGRRDQPAALAGGAPSSSTPPATRASTACTAASDGDVVVVPRSLYDAPAAARRQEEDPMTLRFGLQIGRFTWPGGPAELAARLGAIARAAEEVGFSSISVMDHFVQIPTVGREWEDMPESTATLGFLAAADDDGPPRRARQRHHVPQPRPPGQDRRHARRAVRRPGVLRARRGLVRARARALRLGVPARRPRATSCSRTPSQLLPLMWGKGTPPLRRPHASRSPRRRATRARCRSTCRSSSAAPASGARCASSPATPTPATCSATADVVARKVAVLHEHCAAVGPRPGDGDGHQPVGGGRSSAARPAPPSATATAVGTVEEQVGRYRRLRRGRRRRRPSSPSTSTARPPRSRPSPP